MEDREMIVKAVGGTVWRDQTFTSQGQTAVD